jgi:hypothetical protein
VDLLEVDHHATEILTNEFLEKLVHGVAFWLAILLQELVGEISASLEGKTLGQAESIIAVKKNVLDLLRVSRGSGEVYDAFVEENKP